MQLVRNTVAYPIGGGKGGSVGLQPYLILRVPHRIIGIEIFCCSPT